MEVERRSPGFNGVDAGLQSCILQCTNPGREEGDDWDDLYGFKTQELSGWPQITKLEMLR